METTSKEYTKLIGSVLLATAIVVGLTIMVDNTSSAPIDFSTAQAVGRHPVFVELNTVGSESIVYKLPVGATLRDVFSVARRWLPEEADGDRPMNSGDVVYIDASRGVRFGTMQGVKLVALGLKIPLNHADEKDLQAVPGIGKVLSERIIARVSGSGGIESWQDLRSVKGIGPMTLDRLKRYTSL